jgi:hypothetical protein
MSFIKQAACTLFCLSILCTQIHAQSSVYSPKTRTIGPGFANADKVQQINQTYYGGRLPTLNTSLPLIRLVGTLSMTGQFDKYGKQFWYQLYPFWVDMINMQGGIQAFGKQYNVQMIIADDQSSLDFAEYLYTNWLADPTIDIFQMPHDDIMYKFLTPLMMKSNRTWYNIVNGDPANFVGHYPYILTPANTKVSGRTHSTVLLIIQSFSQSTSQSVTQALDQLISQSISESNSR